MRVNVDSVALADPRFKVLAMALAKSWYDALGRCIAVWALAFERRTEVLHQALINGVAEHPEFATMMIAADLAEAVEHGIRIRGVFGRLEWLELQDQKRKLALEAKRRRVGLPSERPRGSSPTNPRAIPTGRPSSLAPALDSSLAPALGTTPDHEGTALRAESAPEALVSPALEGFKAHVDEVMAKPAKPGRKPKVKPGEPTDLELVTARGVLDKLSKESGHGYRGATEHLRLIVARLRDGVTEQDLRKVVVYCAVELKWAGDDKMGQFLRPETLFGPRSINKYLDPAVSWYAKGDEPAPKETPVMRTSGGALDMSGKEPVWWANPEPAAVA